LKNAADAKHLPENLGTSRDFGLRFALFDRKIFGSFTYYDTKQLNQVRNSLGEIINDFDDVWDTIENAYATLSPATLAAARLPASPPPRPTDDATAVYSRNTAENNGNPGAIFADTLDSKSKGLELELTANPTPNWRLSWSVSQHLSTVSAARKTAIGYYTTHLPTWQRYVDSAGTIVAPLSTVYIQADMRGLRLADMLKAIANGFDETNAEVGGQRYGNREWSSNLVSRYTFREGGLKGWNVGGSVRWRDKALVGYALNPATGFRNPARPFFERDTWTMDAFVGHTRKIFRNSVTWDSNLRVRDLNHPKVWTSVAAAVDSEVSPGTSYPTRRVLMAPISVEFSSSFRW
jgi:hypothetical protein